MKAVRVKDTWRDTTEVRVGKRLVRIYMRSPGYFMLNTHTPSQARRLAAALLKAAAEVEKKGRRK